MEQIDQLKSMRDAAQVRLQANPDFKLKHSLDALIDDLEAFIAADGASTVESAVDVETQDELVASDDEEEQQQDTPVVDEPVIAIDESVVEADEEVSSDLAYADVEQTDAAIGIEENSDGSDEESEIAAAIAANISVEEISGDGDINGMDFVNPTQLDLEAEAAIEALEAELAQTDSASNQSTSNSR